MTKAEKLISSVPISRDAALKSINIPLAHRFCSKLSSSMRANLDPLPGPLEQTFTKGSIQVGKVKVRQVVPSVYHALKAAKSPLLDILAKLAEGKQPELVQMDDTDEWVICWIFTNTSQRVREVLEQGADAVKKTASFEIGDSPDFPSPQLVLIAVMEQMRRSIQTNIQYGTELKESGEAKSFFQDTRDSLTTALDGSQNTSATSPITIPANGHIPT